MHYNLPRTLCYWVEAFAFSDDLRQWMKQRVYTGLDIAHFNETCYNGANSNGLLYNSWTD